MLYFATFFNGGRLLTVCRQVLLNSSYLGNLSLKSSSMEVILHLFKFFKILLSLTRIDLQVLQRKFTWFPTASLLFWAGRRQGVSKFKLRLTQLELRLSLAKTIWTCFGSCMSSIETRKIHLNRNQGFSTVSILLCRHLNL